MLLMFLRCAPAHLNYYWQNKWRENLPKGFCFSLLLYEAFLRTKLLYDLVYLLGLSLTYSLRGVTFLYFGIKINNIALLRLLLIHTYFLFVSLSVCLFVYLIVIIFDCLSIGLYVFLSVVHLIIFLFVCLSNCFCLG